MQILIIIHIPKNRLSIIQLTLISYCCFVNYYVIMQCDLVNQHIVITAPPRQICVYKVIYIFVYIFLYIYIYIYIYVIFVNLCVFIYA